MQWQRLKVQKEAFLLGLWNWDVSFSAGQQPCRTRGRRFARNQRQVSTGRCAIPQGDALLRREQSFEKVFGHPCCPESPCRVSIVPRGIARTQKSRVSKMTSPVVRAIAYHVAPAHGGVLGVTRKTPHESGSRENARGWRECLAWRFPGRPQQGPGSHTQEGQRGQRHPMTGQGFAQTIQKVLLQEETHTVQTSEMQKGS